MTRVVKINDSRDNFTLYIGRRVFADWSTPFNMPASKWANPFRIAGDRTQCLAKYEKYIRDTPELWNSLSEIDDQVLGCWCHDNDGDPTRRFAALMWCHGDVLIKLRQEQLECLNEVIKPMQ
jgi:hypothetical protein